MSGTRSARSALRDATAAWLRSPTPRSFRSRSPPSSAAPSSSATAIIESVGANVSVPAGAQVIDAAGADVYPGFIDARRRSASTIREPGGFGDANEMLDFNPQLRAQVAFHNDSEAIPVRAPTA